MKSETKNKIFSTTIIVLTFIFITLAVVSQAQDIIDYSFFQTKKPGIDSSIKGFQSSDKLWYNNSTYADRSHAKNKYFVRQFKSEYGNIFSDTLNNIIRYMLVQGDCEVHIFYTKNAKPFKIDFLKMFGGTTSFYIIDKDKTCIVDDDSNQSWCTRDTSSNKVEICLDGKKMVYFQKIVNKTSYMNKEGAQEQLKYELNKFDKIKSELALPIVVLGQTSVDEFYGHVPKSIKISADSIKEISIAVYTQIEVDYTYDTIIKLPNSKISAFIDDFNNNVIESSNKQREHQFFSSKNYGKIHYVITFTSKNNNEMFCYLKGQFIGISVWGEKDSFFMYSKLGDVSLFYKLKNKNILKHYLIL